MQNEASIQPLQSPVTEMEANFYYSGLPSRPRLIARSSTTPWEQPIGPWAYSERKELRIVGDHPVVTIWAPEGRDGLSLQVMEILNSKRVQWTALDVIRIAKVGEPSAPVIVWIGILPQSLSPPNGLDVALECKQVLVRNSITDVDVEIRETLVSRSAGPSFLDPICTPYPFAHSYIYHPFAVAFVLKPHETSKGQEASSSLKGVAKTESCSLRLVMSLFPTLRKTTSFTRSRVDLGRISYFSVTLRSRRLSTPPRLRTDMAKKMEVTEQFLKETETEGMDDEKVQVLRALDRAGLPIMKMVLKKCEALHNDLTKSWKASENRVIGHVLYAPSVAFGVGDLGFTEDFAIVQVNHSKLNASNFLGNVIDLGTGIDPQRLNRLIHPFVSNGQNFKYPIKDGLLRLRGTITTNDMYRSPTLNQRDNFCHIVIKRGRTTGLTIGYANNICSYARHYFEDREPGRPGSDSGSVIVDGGGRIGGLLTGGAGSNASTDITYATPIDFLLERIKQRFPKAHLYPVLTAA
ncbi:hypothetical protein AAF712_003777 [Marasmius tenuissimus]|uniref:Uncharacterized protein n=1 Tax=Marasmius tenuissimus TaxID=585030 RepID=A0ABR3A6Y7_9AGAR